MPAPSTQSASSETPLRPKLPLKLGRFTLCEELGAGGMATVYLARMDLAAGLDRLCALKTIHPHLAREKTFVDMFLDEARIASHVSHPNVCAVHDFGELGGVYYLAMEFLLGEPLFDVINRLVDRFDEVREVLPFVAARVIADACEGIHAAHTARGPDGARLHIVHRDVSPQNLFITYEGSVKVVDFGCAKASQRVAHTSTGVMKGKVGYAAPEQLRSDDVDARADVWALGVCLWEALTLSPLFTKETAMKTAMSVLEDPIESAASPDRPWVPEEVAKIAAKALSRDRSKRYASARDMGRDLRKFIADSGFTLESAELAEWMGFLFEDRHEERASQAARARELDVTHAIVALPEMLGDVAAGDVELLPDSMSAMEAIALHEPRVASERPPPPLPARASDPPPRSRRRGLMLLIALVALGLAGFYFHKNYEIAPWALELVGMSPPAPDAVPAEPAGATSDDATDTDATDTGATDTGATDTDATDIDTPSDSTADTDTSSDDAHEAPAVDTAPPTAAADAGPTKAPRRRPREGGGVTTLVSGGSSGSTSGGSTSAPVPSSSGSVAVAPPAGGGAAFVNLVPTSGWADVYLGGRLLGRTPLRRELPAGTHRLRVLPYGREPATVLTIDIDADIDQRLEIDLPPPPPGM